MFTSSAEISLKIEKVASVRDVRLIYANYDKLAHYILHITHYVDD